MSGSEGKILNEFVSTDRIHFIHGLVLSFS